MADATSGADDAPITFHVKSSNDAKYTLSLPASTPVSELKEKLAASEYADTPADRQRLIYSGRVLKDNETLSTYKIKDGHTIHLVKSAPSNQRQAGPSQSPSTATSGAATSAAAGVPTNLAAGTGNNPLAGLTGARYAGFAQLPGAGMFGPDGGMGPPADPETMIQMLDNPQVQSSLNEALQNPAMIEMMISQNPMLRELGPAARQMFQNPDFRRMMTDPNAMRQAMQMQRMFGGGGAAPASAFPAPGVTNTTPQENQAGQQNNNNGNTTSTPGSNPASPPTAGTPMFNPFAPSGLGAGNPFAALFNGTPGAGANPAGTQNTAGTEANADASRASPAAGEGQAAQNPLGFLLNNPGLFGGQGGQGGQGGFPGGINPFDPQQNPFLQDPAFAQRVLQGLGGAGGAGGAGANPFASLFGGSGFGGSPFGSPPPQDTRPPEEQYAEQLRQLNDMGFFEFERNVEALRRAGGSVNGAVEYLLSHPS